MLDRRTKRLAIAYVTQDPLSRAAVKISPTCAGDIVWCYRTSICTTSLQNTNEAAIADTMGLSPHTRHILRRLHDAIHHGQGKGQNGFNRLRSQLHDSCVTSRRSISEQDFQAAVVATGLLSAEDAGVLFRGVLLASGEADQDDKKLLPIATVRWGPLIAANT